MADQEKREYNLRRLHSLLGVIPIGLFLMQHLVVNHFSTYSEEAFNTAAGFMENLPLRIVLEFGLIYIPFFSTEFMGCISLWYLR